MGTWSGNNDVVPKLTSHAFCLLLLKADGKNMSTVNGVKAISQPKTVGSYLQYNAPGSFKFLQIQFYCPLFVHPVSYQICRAYTCGMNVIQSFPVSLRCNESSLIGRMWPECWSRILCSQHFGNAWTPAAGKLQIFLLWVLNKCENCCNHQVTLPAHWQCVLLYW